MKKLLIVLLPILFLFLACSNGSEESSNNSHNSQKNQEILDENAPTPISDTSIWDSENLRNLNSVPNDFNPDVINGDNKLIYTRTAGTTGIVGVYTLKIPSGNGNDREVIYAFFDNGIFYYYCTDYPDKHRFYGLYSLSQSEEIGAYEVLLYYDFSNFNTTPFETRIDTRMYDERLFMFVMSDKLVSISSFR